MQIRPDGAAEMMAGCESAHDMAIHLVSDDNTNHRAQGQLEEIPDIVKSLKNPLAHCADRAGNTLRTDMYVPGHSPRHKKPPPAMGVTDTDSAVCIMRRCNDDMIDMGTLPGHHAGASGEMPEIEEVSINTTMNVTMNTCMYVYAFD